MSKKFIITTEKGSKIEMLSGMEIVVSIDRQDYKIDIKEI